MKLYHFTTGLHVPDILKHGLSRGDVPISPTLGENAVWFTTDHTGGAGDDHGLAGSLVDKREFRITVAFDRSDRLLHRWTDYMAIRRVDKTWARAINKAGGNRERNWWLYRGTVPVSRFAEIARLAPLGYQRVDLQRTTSGWSL